MDFAGSADCVRFRTSLNLAQTFTCGQCFRFTETAPGIFEGAAGNRYLRLEQQGDGITLHCSEEEFQSFWRNYFDLDTDYEEKQKTLAALSPMLKEAERFAPGIRILRQNPWEALISFIISQNNNIPRIMGIIARLCERFGDPIPAPLRGFPSPQTLASLTLEDLAPLRAGFRGKYILDAARKVVSGEVDLKKIANAPVEFGREELQKIMGVGPKVAECALLYGFHKTQCFPMDVWMKRAMAVLLPGISPEIFGENAGLAQQYIFHYSRMHAEIFQ